MGTMLFIKSFFKRIIDDFNQRELLPLKLLFFVHASTLFVLYPYLTIHMRELGINVEETAIMSAVTPIVGIIMPPLAGMVADRIGNFKILLAIFSSLGGASALLLLLVPVGRVTIMYPSDAVLSMGCAGGRMFLDQADPYPCSPGNSSVFVNMSVRSCGFVCQPPSGMVLFPDEIRNYTVEVSSAVVGDPSTYGYTLAPKLSLPQDQQVDEDVRAHRTLHLNERFGSSVRNITLDYFFPAPEHLSHHCEDGSCHFVHEMLHDAHTFFNVKNVSVQLKRRANELFTARIGAANNSLHNATCTDQFSQDGSQVRILLPRPGDDPVVFSSCVRRCLVTVPRKSICKQTDIKHELDVNVTFWLYLAIRVVLGMIGGTAFAMFEGAIIAILREHKADYGLQRIYASIGGMISSPLSGLLIDYASQGKGYTDFRPAFYLYAGLKIASGLLILTINLEFKTPAKNVVSDVINVLKNIELIALLFVIFVLGSAWGFIENFLFWLLQDLGGKSSLMGITITVGGIAGIPLLVLSGPIIDKIGHANVLFTGFVFYAIRLLGYSLIYNPWHCLIFEAMESVTTSLSFTAAVTYAAKLSTTTTDTSIQGLLGGLYFGVGKGTGSLVGGYLMKAIGTRHTYQVFSAMCAVVGSMYFFINKFYLRKRPQTEGNDIVKEKSKFMDKSAKKKKTAVETAPINDEVSKTYSTNDVANGKDVKTTPVECNVNLAYEDAGDSTNVKDTEEKADAGGGVDNPAVELEDVVSGQDQPDNNKDQADTCK